MSIESYTRMRRRISSRLGAAVVAVFIIFVLWQTLKSQQELNVVSDRLEDQRRAFLIKNGAHKLVLEKSHELKKWENRTGLNVKNRAFFIDDKPFQLLGGSLHYFRFPSDYWHARLLALKACGLNTVTTYIPWNAHEPVEGEFNFSGMLDISKFLEIAHSLQLYVILRVGPYICAEWEWGGLPSWLLRHDQLSVRSNDPIYMAHVQHYFNKLLPLLVPYQYTYGGPVIAIQVENEFARYSSDPRHVIKLRDMIVERGIVEFLFVCDDKHGVMKDLDYGGMMKSINFQHEPTNTFQILRKFQPAWPLFVSEYWTGWFNTWGGKNNNRGVPWLNTLDTKTYENNTKEAFDFGKNVNFYMFAGGTNFGFMNGGVVQKDGTSPDTTSYDYDALVSEEGGLTAKYNVTRRLIQAMQPITQLIQPPPAPRLVSYSPVTVDTFLTLWDLLVGFRTWMIKTEYPISMEKLPAINDRKAGQSYGYVLYEADMRGPAELRLGLHKNVRDRAHIFINNVYQETITSSSTEITLKVDENTKICLSFLVENQGRVNWVDSDQTHLFNDQRKGIVGNITLNGKNVQNWRILPLEFDDHFLMKLKKYIDDKSIFWRSKIEHKISGLPALISAKLVVHEAVPVDTFMELEGFEKGFVIVNGFNLGRYWNSAGPQKRLFVPGVWLRQGSSEVLVFEERQMGNALTFHTTSGI